MADNRFLPLLRLGFVTVALGFAWHALQGRSAEIVQVLRDSSTAALGAALLLVCLGLLATAALWLHVMARLEGRLPAVPGLAVFFVGQLGKYVPGSVWVLGAQADLARRHSVPPRLTVVAGLIFLGLHVDTAVLLASTTVLRTPDQPWPTWASWALLLAAIVTLTPPVIRWCARRILRRELVFGWRDVAVALGLMAVAWSAYACSLVLMTADRQWSAAVELGGAFAAAYTVGVLVVLAPAGLGAREGVFVLLATSSLGMPAATALAVLARLVHTTADVLLAGGCWLLARRVQAERTAAVLREQAH